MDNPNIVKPHFHLRKEAGVIVPLPVRDEDGRYHIWLLRGSEYIHVSPVDLAVSDYFSKTAASPEDIFSPFVDFMWQRCRHSKALKCMTGITQDMYNLSACLRKLEIYHGFGKKEIGVSRFVITEIEYIVGVCRSQYDILQHIAHYLWESVSLNDKTKKKKTLPKSFMDMIGEKACHSAGDLQKKYCLGPKWAGFYSNEADFFLKLRKFRNDIEHGGLTPETIFNTPKGFAVQADSKIFSEFGDSVWKEETFLENRLAPLKPVLAHIISTTLATMLRFAESISKEIKFDKEIAPGYFVFMRGYYINRLALLKGYMTTDVWYPERGEKIPDAL